MARARVRHILQKRSYDVTRRTEQVVRRDKQGCVREVLSTIARSKFSLQTMPAMFVNKNSTVLGHRIATRSTVYHPIFVRSIRTGTAKCRQVMRRV